MLLLLFGSYRAVERVLRFVLLVFVAYILSAFLAHPDWDAVLHDTLHPRISFTPTYVQGILALMGTTLTSYAYVWESIEEAEEQPPISSLGPARADAGLGMFFAVAIFWFILIGTGATLGVHHQQVQTAQDAAQALQPLAGSLASDLFALGLLASSVLAVPVLAATSGYLLGQEFGWASGLSVRIWQAKGFNAALIGALLVGVAIAFLGISPIRLLLLASIAGGLGTPISLVFLLLVARKHDVMGTHPIGLLLYICNRCTAISPKVTSRLNGSLTCASSAPHTSSPAPVRP
jgi:Mn2+/Fe2+ NRAMP family transporter